MSQILWRQLQHVDTVLIPVSWYVVEKDVNDRIYVAEEGFSSLGRRIATNPPEYYDDVYYLAPWH